MAKTSNLPGAGGHGVYHVAKHHQKCSLDLAWNCLTGVLTVPTAPGKNLLLPHPAWKNRCKTVSVGGGCGSLTVCSSRAGELSTSRVKAQGGHGCTAMASHFKKSLATTLAKKNKRRRTPQCLTFSIVVANLF
jgi:hypothetical protein